MPLAVEARDVHLDAGLGEREVVGLQPRAPLGAEQRARGLLEGPGEVGQRDALPHREALDLREHRRVGGVGVAAVDGAGDDDEDRRLLGLHGAHLHRRGVGAQDDVPRARRQAVLVDDALGQRGGIEVEGVLDHPRRMARRVVQGGEVVVVVLDLGALEHAVAQPDEDVLDLAPRARDQVQVPGADRRAPGEGHVERAGREALSSSAPSSSAAPGLERLLDGRARLVGGLADGAALVGRQLADAPQDPRSARTCARAGAPAGPRARRRSAAAAIASSASARSFAILSVMALRRAPRRRPKISAEGDGRRGGDVERLGAAGPERDRPPRRADGQHDLGQAVALGAEAERERRGHRARGLPAVRHEGHPRRGRRARHPAGERRPRRSSPCSPARPSASAGRRSRDRGRRCRRRERRPSGSRRRRCPGRATPCR